MLKEFVLGDFSKEVCIAANIVNPEFYVEATLGIEGFDRADNDIIEVLHSAIYKLYDLYKAKQVYSAIAGRRYVLYLNIIQPTEICVLNLTNSTKQETITLFQQFNKKGDPIIHKMKYAFSVLSTSADPIDLSYDISHDKNNIIINNPRAATYNITYELNP
jgi:hypothetical protein